MQRIAARIIANDYDFFYQSSNAHTGDRGFVLLAIVIAPCKNRVGGVAAIVVKAINRMRIFKFIAALLLPVLMTLALVFTPERTRLWAQLPPSNPNLGPAVTPSGPPQLAQPAATIGIPTLAVIPTPLAPAVSTAARVFNCSCFGPSSGTRWMGQISATGYFAARQGAIGACVSYNELKQPPSPFNEPRSFAGLALAPPALPAGTQPANAAASQLLPGNLNFSLGKAASVAVVSSAAAQVQPGTISSAPLQACSQCTCN